MVANVNIPYLEVMCSTIFVLIHYQYVFKHDSWHGQLLPNCLYMYCVHARISGTCKYNWTCAHISNR